jgi:glycosyltransferase involved in cell wall biosynthesis
MYLTPHSVSDGNIFLALREHLVERPCEHDLLFVDGMDWRTVDQFGLRRDRVPVINLVQNTRHANPGDPRRAWLGRRATRVCVSQEVADAILATGEVNGPVHVIPNGLAPLDALRLDPSARSVDVFIGGLKDPPLARELAAQLAPRGISVDLACELIPRQAYLSRMAQARVAVLLTIDYEGSFLPALEAMALEVAVVCPDTPGIHGYCRPSETALLTARRADALAASALGLLREPALAARLRANGRSLAARHTLERERAAFLEVLAGVLRA